MISKMILLLAVAAFAGPVPDSDCLRLIREAKRRGSYRMEFWSHQYPACYGQIKDEKSGLKRRLEKMGYEVFLSDYRHFHCTDYCYAAIVEWTQKKDIGLSRKEREKVARLWEKGEQDNADACERVMLGGTSMTKDKPDPKAAAQCQSSAARKIKFFVPCLKRTGNVGRCHNEFYKVKK
jgi:hypothetical protein